MNIRTLLTTAALLCAAFALPAQAQHAGHDMHDMKSMPATPAELSSGEVRAIDLKTRKLTIKHGELKNLGMPAMTMVFVIKEGVAVPAGLKQGDAIRFRAEEVGGVLTVTLIQR